MVSELSGNSVRHSRSADLGELVTVAVRAKNGMVRVEVTGRSGTGVPELCRVVVMAEQAAGFSSRRGLAARWGRRRGGRTVTWFELRV